MRKQKFAKEVLNETEIAVVTVYRNEQTPEIVNCKINEAGRWQRGAGIKNISRNVNWPYVKKIYRQIIIADIVNHVLAETLNAIDKKKTFIAFLNKHANDGYSLWNFIEKRSRNIAERKLQILFHCSLRQLIYFN